MFASLIVLVAANGWTFVFITAKHGTGKDRAKWAKEGPVQDMPKLGVIWLHWGKGIFI